MASRGFQVIRGGASGSDSKTQTYDTGLVDPSGYRIVKDAPQLASGGGGGSGGGSSMGGEMTPLWRLDIPRDVQIAKWGLASLFLAFGGSVYFLWGEFKDVRSEIGEVEVSVARQTGTLEAVQKTADRIEAKLEQLDEPKAGNNPKSPS